VTDLCRDELEEQHMGNPATDTDTRDDVVDATDEELVVEEVLVEEVSIDGMCGVY
jgi:mycofactocin precursor